MLLYICEMSFVCSNEIQNLLNHNHSIFAYRNIEAFHLFVKQTILRSFILFLRILWCQNRKISFENIELKLSISMRMPSITVTAFWKSHIYVCITAWNELSWMWQCWLTTFYLLFLVVLCTWFWSRKYKANHTCFMFMRVDWMHAVISFECIERHLNNVV